MKNLFPLILCFLVATFAIAQSKKNDTQDTTEVFRVSKVGVRGAAESRELLMDLYAEVGKEYNANIEKESTAQKVAYQGKQVRILKVLKETENGAPMYLAAYNGEPSVVAIARDKKFKEGVLTPALKIQANGQHETKVTREIVERAKNNSPEPTLEKSSGGGVSFFGIPIDTGGGGSISSNEVEETVTRRRVTEVKTMPKYVATISDEVLNDGPAKFSKDIFVDSLKNGNVYSVKRKEDRRCQNCRGFQRVTTTLPVGLRDPDGKMPCPECKGIGNKPWNVTYQVAW